MSGSVRSGALPRSGPSTTRSRGHRVTAHSFRSQVATPEAINDHESGIAVHVILAATNRKRHRKRDFAVAVTEKIMSDTAGLARLVPFRGSKAHVKRRSTRVTPIGRTDHPRGQDPAVPASRLA